MQGNEYTASLPTHVSDSKQQTRMKPREARVPTKRVYREWQGSNRFFFGGRLIFGPDVRSMIITIFLIGIPVLLFEVFVSQRLVNEFKSQLGNLIITIPVVFAAYIVVVLFLTSSRDPGIIPRNAHPPEPEYDGSASSVSADWVGAHSSPPNLPPIKDVVVNGIIVKVKYCHTCMLYRPPRCSHCSICDNCVERFDHHCPWVGQCIGKRNYRFFYMFVSSTTLLCLYVFAFCWVNLAKTMGKHHCNLWRAITKSPASASLIIYTFIAAWFVGGLTGFHTYLVCTNQTTYENFRYRYDGRLKNPYNRGILLNVKEIFFSSIPKSQNHFRARVNEDLPAISTYASLGRALSPDMAKASHGPEIDGKRQAVGAEEFHEIQSQIESVGGLGRRGTMPSNSSWDGEKGGGEVTPDLEALAAEFGMEHGSTVIKKG